MDQGQLISAIMGTAHEIDELISDQDEEDERIHHLLKLAYGCLLLAKKAARNPNVGVELIIQEVEKLRKRHARS